MDRSRWEAVRRVYHEALRQAEYSRTAYLTDACGLDSSLRLEVESLLACARRAGNFLEPPSSVPADWTHQPNSEFVDTPVGHCIGRYKLLRVIGHGGMGIVYEAEQENPRRTVALKLIRPGLDTTGVMRRFAQEAQVLGRLAHPGIAQIFEAGAAETRGGLQPFFAMEVVAGEPITAYARARRLSLPDRLALFASVCGAVQHAHEKAVLHRDLKPGNILVTRDGRPKVLDFGVACVIGDDPQATTLRTKAGEIIGTLAYMSPEQARGDIRDLDTRSDIYSLGVILFELLTERMPYDLAGNSFVEVGCIISEQRPARIGAIRRDLPADLDTVVQKALEKDPSRRYASADALAGDIGRFLAKRPILARPPSAGYQLRKFVSRNRVASSIVASLLLGLLGLTATSLWLAGRYADQRDQAAAAAQREAEARQQSETVSDFFLMDLFEVTDPQKARVEKLTAREVLDKGAQRIQEKFRGQPETQATLMISMGRVYENLGLGSKAHELFESALRIREAIFGSENADVATAKFHLARVTNSLPMQREVLEIRRRLLGDDHVQVADAHDSLANLLLVSEKHEESEQHAQQALAIYRARRGARSTEVATCLMRLGALRNSHARYQEAEPLYRAALEINQELFGEKHAAVANSLSGLGYSLENNADYVRAAPFLERAVAIAREIHGEDSPQLARYLGSLGRNLYGLGRLKEAEAAYRESLAIHNKLYGEDSGVLDQLANVLAARFDYDGAASTYEKSWQIRMRGRETPLPHEAFGHCVSALFHLEKPDFEAADRISRESYASICETSEEGAVFRVIAQHHRGLVLGRLGRFDEAEQLLQRSLELIRRLFPENHMYVAQMQDGLGVFLTERGKYDAAESMLRDALNKFELLGESGAENRSNTLYNLAGALAARGDYEKALPFYGQALELRKNKSGEDHPTVGLVLLRLAELHHDQGDPATARPLYEESLAMLQKVLKQCHPEVLAARIGLAKLVGELGDLDDAVARLEDALDDQISVMGEDHPHVGRTQCLLGACQAAQGNATLGESKLTSGVARLQAAYPTAHRYVREALALRTD